MHINFYILSYVIFLGMIMSFYDTKHNRGIYIILCCVILLLVAVLRHPAWLTYHYSIDTLGYMQVFEESCNLGWSGFKELIIQKRLGNDPSLDIGYYGLMAVIGWFTNSFFVFSFIADLVFFVPFGIILYRYCTNMRQIIFSFVFYIALLQVSFLGGGRQIFAIGFDLMALLAVIDKKRWRAIILFLVGVTIHLSSLLFVIPLLMIWFNTNSGVLKWLHIICFVLFPLILLYPGQVIVFMGNIVASERYANYGMDIQGGATTFITLIELLSLYCLVAIKKKDLQDNSSVRFFYAMAPLFTIFAPLITANGAMIRVSLYYHLFIILLVPFATDCMFKDKTNNKIVYFILIVALAFLTLKDGGVEYYFFWQNPLFLS